MTWQEFKTDVLTFMLVDADRLGTTTFRDNIIRQAVIDMQRCVETYRLGHETVFDTDDLIVNGQASQGQLPDQANLRDSYVITVGNRCKQYQLQQYPWSNRNDLICGNMRMHRGQGWFAIDPQALTFLAWPAIREGEAIQLFWDGQKLSFQDSDTVPFGEAAAFAAHHMLQAYFEKNVNHDIKAFGVEMALFNKFKAKCYIDENDRKRLKESSETASNVAACKPCCTPANPETTDTPALVEFVAFGASGESPLDNTEDVAELVKNIDPDFIVHLGNTNYPSGSSVTLPDYLTKWYWGYIQTENWIQSWGPVDDGTDSGQPLLDLLTWIAEFNSDKRYYNIVKGHAEFFVIHSGISDGTPDDPDGITFNSTQGAWIQAAMAASGARWKIPVFKRSGYTSDVVNYPGSAVMAAWPLKDWGADVVINAGGNNYERLLIDGLPIINIGLGGATRTDFNPAPVSGSQFRYNAQFGVVKGAVTETTLQLNMIGLNNAVIDNLLLVKPT